MNERVTGENADGTFMVTVDVLYNLGSPAASWATPQIEKAGEILEDAVRVFSVGRASATYLGCLEYREGQYMLLMVDWKNTRGEDALKSTKTQIMQLMITAIMNSDLQRLCRLALRPDRRRIKGTEAR